MLPRHLLAPVAALALATAGCGGGTIGLGTTPPTASAPDAPAPPPDATQPGTGPVTTPTTTQPRRARGGGARHRRAVHRAVRRETRGRAVRRRARRRRAAGGAQAVRVPAAYVALRGERLRPATITIPPFLAVEISLRSADGRSHRLLVRGPTAHALLVGPGGRAAMRIAGLRAGRYPVVLDGRRAGMLVAGGEVGP